MNYIYVVAEGRIEKLKEIAEKIVEKMPCKIISQPSPGMIMIKNIDPLEKTYFYMGEAFVTKCEVEVGGNMGFGCVIGDEPERAIYGAIIDAVIDKDFDGKEQIQKMLSDEDSYLNQEWDKYYSQVSKTKVNFNVKKG